MEIKTCKDCHYCSINKCLVLANVNISEINKCPLEYESIKKYTSNDLGKFLLNGYTMTLLKYINTKSDIPNIGDKCVTLRGGFNSYEHGIILTVINKNDKYLILKDEYDKEFLLYFYEWTDYIFKLEE